jgi:hypothetical protein
MKRHPFDPIALVFGLTFTVVGAILLNTDVDVGDFALKWAWPALILFVGLMLGALAIRRLLRD